MKEAGFYKKLGHGRVQCGICPHHCVLEAGATGICSGMKNVSGVLYSLNYGKITALHLDPIEKKPLFHFKPGSMVLSLGSFGCNFRCGFCQNHAIALDPDPVSVDMSIKDLLAKALETPGNIGLAYTYNEPTVYFDMVLDLAEGIKAQGQDNIFVTNGFIDPRPLKTLIPFLDGVNVDIKSFDENFYKREIKGGLGEVLRTVEALVTAGVHVEITHLLIEGVNDELESFKRMVEWIKALSKEIPLHVSRYFPAFTYTIPATSPGRIRDFVREARGSLDYVYAGNLVGEDIDTYCPNCGYPVVERGYRTLSRLKLGHCPHCGQKIPVI